MLTLSSVIDELFSCLGPLRACQEPIQDRCVNPIQDHMVDPVREHCVDPALHALEVNPLGCIPWLGVQPSLPQNDSEPQQRGRAEQLGRTQPSYQYNYGLVRTFRVEENGQGVQGKGIAILDSLPFEQLPSLCWIMSALQQALLVVDNLLAVLELLNDRPEGTSGVQVAAPKSKKSLSSRVPAIHEASLFAATFNDVDPEELERRTDEVKELRQNLVGTLGWSQRIANHV